MKYQLEISPLQTGKSTRLCEAIHDYVSEDRRFTAYAVCPSFDRSEYLKKLYIKIFGLALSPAIIFCSSNQDIDILTRGRDSFHYRFFLDEFDFFEKYSQQFFKFDTYLTTTPKKTRKFKDQVDYENQLKTDFLLQILNLNRGQYIATCLPMMRLYFDHNYPEYKRTMRDYKRNLGPVQYSKEFEAKFLK